MRKLIVLLAVAALAAASVAGSPADAKKKKKKKKVVIRTAEAAYDSPAIGAREVTGVCSGSNGCATFPVGANERSLVLEVTDQLGQPVALTVGQDTDTSNATTEVVAKTCGGKTEPIAIEPGVEVMVWMWVAPGVTPPCPGVATTGTVKATFSTAAAG